jgi:O-antigen/teichoic acid export membrane protein
LASFVEDLLSVFYSKGIIILLGLVTSIITARYIGPEGNGLIAGIMVYPSLFMSLGSLGIQQSTAYFLGKNIFSENQIKTAVSQIWIITTLFSILVSFLLIYYFSNSGKNIVLVILALIPIPFSLFITYNSGIFLGKNNIGTYNKINWIPPAVSFLGTIVFVVLISLDVVGALLSTIIGPMLIAFVLVVRNNFSQAFSLNYDWKVIKPMLSLGIVYSISLLIINLNYKIDIVLLDKLSNTHELGVYVKGSAVTQYLWQIPMLFSTLVFARSAVSKNEIQFSYKVAQLLRLSFVFIGFASLILYLFSEMIIVGMYGEPFRGSIEVLNYLLPGVLILTIYKVMNMDLAGKGKPWISMKAMLPSLVLNIVLNVLLIPDYGAIGASIASTISYCVAGILFLVFYSVEVNIPIKIILSYKKSDFQPIIDLIKKLRN